MHHIAFMADPATAALAFIDGLGGPEMVMVFVVVLLLFGGQKLPEFARGLGKTMREFKKAASGVEDEFRRALEEDERKKYTPPPAPPPAPAPVTVEPATALSPDEAANATADEISATGPLTPTAASETHQPGMENADPYMDGLAQSPADPELQPAAPEAQAVPEAKTETDGNADGESRPKTEPSSSGDGQPAQP